MYKDVGKCCCLHHHCHRRGLVVETADPCSWLLCWLFPSWLVSSVGIPGQGYFRLFLGISNIVTVVPDEIGCAFGCLVVNDLHLCQPKLHGYGYGYGIRYDTGTRIQDFLKNI